MKAFSGLAVPTVNIPPWIPGPHPGFLGPETLIIHHHDAGDREMPVRTASAEWQGDLPKGRGTIKSQTGAIDGQYSFSSRFEEGTGTNPEELIAAAHAGCYSMALSNMLAQAGHTPTRVKTAAKVHLNKVEGGVAIDLIELTCRAVVPGLDAAGFQEHAENAKVGCPVSRALAAVTITLDAALEA